MKRHFIFLGAPGIIYYSWLLVVIFVGVSFAYESNKTISLPSLILCSLFVILLIYTWFFSYTKRVKSEEFEFKLPYRKKSKISKPQIIFQWHFIRTLKINDKYQKYYVIEFNRKKELSNGI
ncbi:hypothetical protein [Lactobacillus sp. PV034]|uniref:hypothetical protein n=1 Tax=Lactobacillus sp. PV034 TaxID=2594495 RepID=UPI00223E9A95|nr:hypothetical protein [Lactobacillus sp. PV034]QNQ80418.1 hypothetical protein FP432_02045 [Lactobacillus sp. PV034]